MDKRQSVRETMMLVPEVKSHLVDKLKDSAAGGKTKSRAASGREFHVNSGSGRVGSSWVGSSRVGSRKLDPRSTLEKTDRRKIKIWTL